MIAPEQMSKLEALRNREIMDLVKKYEELMEPETVFVCTDSKEDYE